MTAYTCPRCGCDVVAERDRINRIEGPEIRRRREASGLSLRFVAQMVRISPAHLSNVERGRQAPSDALRQRLEYLLAGYGSPAPRGARREGAA